MAAQQAIGDGNAGLSSFGNHPAAVAVHSIAFGIGQDDRVRFTGRLQWRRPVRRIREAKMLHSRRNGQLQEDGSVSKNRCRF